MDNIRTKPAKSRGFAVRLTVLTRISRSHSSARNPHVNQHII